MGAPRALFLETFYPNSLCTAVLLLLLALLLDYAYPYHRGILLAIHPVHTCYVLSKKMVKPYASRLYGVFLGLTCITVHVGLMFVPLYLAAMAPNPWNTVAWLLVASWFMKTSFSIKLLVDLGYKVYHAARENKWDETRYWVQQMVRRNVYKLDREHVLSAAIESLAESLVDGFVSPLFYYPFLGVLGPYLQRLANTLDGSVGFKTPELCGQGWFSAKLDTLLNYVPARLTVLYIGLSSMMLGLDWRNAWRINRRDHGLTESLNAGHPISAMAGALGVRLEKPGHYSLGDSLKPVEPGDVERAVRVIIVSSILHVLVIVLLLFLFYSFIYPTLF